MSNQHEELNTTIIKGSKQDALQMVHDPRLKVLLKLNKMADVPLEEIIAFVVEECQKISESQLAFVGFINENETIMDTHIWARNAMEQCAVDGKPIVFRIEKAGLWGEAIRQKKSIIVNTYEDHNPYKKGYPEWHVPLIRFMAVPVIENGHVVLVAGLANKSDPYKESDAAYISLLLEGMWNIIQRKKVEDKYRAEREKLDILTENAPFGLVMIEKDGKFSYINPKFTEITGYEISDISSGKEWFRMAYPDPSYRHEVISVWLNDLETTRKGEQRPRVFMVTCKDGTQKIINFIPVLFEGGRNMVTIEDITARKKTEKTLRESKENLYAAINSIHDSLIIIDRSGKVLLANITVAKRIGKNSGELPGTYLYDNFSDEVAKLRKEKFDSVFATGNPVHFEDERNCVYYENYAYPVLSGEDEISRIVIFARDITKEKLAEEALKKSEENYRSIFENAAEGIFQTTPEGRFISLNPAMARMHGFASPEEMLKDISSINKQLILRAEDGKRYIRTLLKDGKTRQFETEVRRRDGGIIWVSINARVIKDAAGKIIRYEGTSEDITEQKKAAEDLRISASKLRKRLVGTIDVISTMLEKRDPYTAGHQRRVSRLARSIAQELGLQSDVVDSIRIAGNIHDIGKMSVPAEILVKPGRLSEIEMELIKAHPRTGYDILKVVDLPAPTAEIVLQHHERLDGSGYPQGLKGEQIILEAQIIAVADVVEAMASHRPYRPSRGIEAALEEIERNSGILYHRDVVDVCLRLFREKGFSFGPNDA